MTSANPGGEPLVAGNDEAVARLGSIADALLVHDRDIVVRCDDSVAQCAATATCASCAVRAAMRPMPSPWATPAPPVLALGAHMKNTVCVTRGNEAFVSQHIGTLDNAATVEVLEETTDHLLKLLQVEPVVIAHDLHPDFASTRLAHALAERHDVPTLAVQHHHAHIAAVAAEHRPRRPVAGTGAGRHRPGQRRRRLGRRAAARGRRALPPPGAPAQPGPARRRPRRARTLAHGGCRTRRAWAAAMPSPGASRHRPRRRCCNAGCWAMPRSPAPAASAAGSMPPPRCSACAR